MEPAKRRIAILGSTGSIGTQALEVISTYPGEFTADIITANENAGLLIEQAIQFEPNAVVIGNEKKYPLVRDALASYPVKVYAGSAAIEQIVESDSIDIVLAAMVGFSGLKPTISAIRAGKSIALANKETLVVAGAIIKQLAIEHNVSINPIDSEHSAIFQCLAGEQGNAIEKIYLTASGGPLLNKTIKELETVTPEEALKHPNWNMGDKITIDSATLMNKGLEMIEAKWLFGLEADRIEVIVHPQSVIHSIVQFEDGSMKAQMGLPDMKLPILYALAFPQRLKTGFPRFNFVNYPQLSFQSPDTKKFRNLALAYRAMEQCGNMPCALNAANEVVVDAFLKKKTGFLKMPEIIEKTMLEIQHIPKPSLDDLFETDAEARIMSLKFLNQGL
ncbi:MAG: 1-deoxy-D-xylulose-5-phosphate reductoisomerase [Bacteroidota bacterium]